MNNYQTKTNALIFGASRGIGLGFVKALLEKQDVNIYATYRRRNVSTELLSLETTHPQALHCLAVDVTKEDQIANLSDYIQQTESKLHLVINCVGILHQGALQPEKSVGQIHSENLVYYFRVNSIASALIAKHFLPLFCHSNKSILAFIGAKIGSISDNNLGGWYGYRASKAALNMLMRTIAIEYGRKCPQTIVVSLHPGTTDTDLSKPFQKNIPPHQLFSIERTVNQLLKVINSLTEDDSGYFFSWDGNRVPW
ncbi:SDR family dehydrogenase/reductase [cyanobacterium endosymbiont of Rhopalodia gibberula]|uniref:SDR family NAD(P)-dependent oxidoreductase n=1 Tax=cyanobacterium endosymbiont of Rhopalodia gibberula TaxID=1763363 RepID=UPI000DC71932|nr:SDR family NAD(P)-dependent oxidoreductase [cyanobacterium endosymbiont of Rhopalodia gibberula]BBA79194.1 SDR family dehydrogenase/reductase [cyanobacterium endosymbiont of Rhopalodia gibberula]